MGARPTDETTVASGGAAETRRSSSPSSHSGWLSSSQPGDGRFASGTILADRYRIIGLLGRGGMGEVYRADDLRLGQPVALKFLPESVSGDPQRLAQFHNEVRMARQVSHRNVCRVYDIGEADGRIFLTMEFVDGEDLASLLHRIGRFPPDRAVEIARQLCAGLAAAHDQGVLHRDLKPANVMLDREGRVRITDFGLAGVAGEIQDVRAGTPAYMAPEQLAGRDVSIRSDFFSLGLVLYEIFTGRRAFDPKNVAELLRMHDEGLSITPSNAVRDLDPAIERVILRCLERDPARRPASAIAVSASLPGGDPLAVALAAGETPSPEMVANAGVRDAIAPLYGLSAIAVVLAGIVAMTMMSYQLLILHRVPSDRPPAVLADKARSIRESLGYREAPFDSARGFWYDSTYEAHVARTRRGPDRWRELPSGRARTAVFWYRTSPEPLVPSDASQRVGLHDPPLTTARMALVEVDTVGRLLGFHAIPPQHETAPTVAPRPTGAGDAAGDAIPRLEPDWRALFAAADLPMDRFTPVTPEWTPRAYADRRAAWTGTLAEAGNLPLRIEAAAHRGRVTSFRIIYPWNDPEPSSRPQTTVVQRVAEDVGELVYLGLFLVALVMARRNVRLKRGDRAGAFRIGAIAFACAMLNWALSASHVGDANIWEDKFFLACGLSLLQAFRLWIFYLALEPTVRRFWPAGLISWSRLLGGDWRDPLVGWHVLAGVACGVVLQLALKVGRLLPALLGQGPPVPEQSPIWFLDSMGTFAGFMAQTVNSGLSTALFIVFCYAVARRFLRRDLYATLALGVLLSVAIAGEFVQGEQLLLEVGFLVSLVLLIVVMLRRFGLLAAAATFMVNQLLNVAPLTFELSAWYAYAFVWVLVLILAVTIYGFVTSRAGAPLFGRAFLGDAADA
jgi:Protein kinase domain